MRDIKFRAWHRTTHHMYPAQTLQRIAEAERTHIIDGYDKLDIMQYTGLKDKNDLEIYEGDRAVMRSKTWHGRGTIEFVEGSFVFKQYESAGRDQTIVELSQLRFANWQIEIIGNIYEHPKPLQEVSNHD